MTSFLPVQGNDTPLRHLAGGLSRFAPFISPLRASFSCAPERRAGLPRQLSRERKKHGVSVGPLMSSGFRQTGVDIATHVIAASLSLIQMRRICHPLFVRVRRTIAAGRFPYPVTRPAAQFPGFVGCHQHLPCETSNSFKTFNLFHFQFPSFRHQQSDMGGFASVQKAFAGEANERR